MNKAQAIQQIMKKTEFTVENKTSNEEWDAESQSFKTVSIVWSIRMQQEFESTHRDTWVYEIEALTRHFFEKTYEEQMDAKFSGLVGDVLGTTTNLWRPRCSYLIWGGVWLFETKRILHPAAAVRMVAKCYRKAWNSLLWCDKHQCFSNDADKEGYLFCLLCHEEEWDRENDGKEI